MARSYKNPHYSGACTGVDTDSRRAGARRLRRINRQRVRQGQPPLLRREVDNNWDWPTDGGNRYYVNPFPGNERK